MYLTPNLKKNILFDPIRRGADELLVVSGYATAAMASWHIKKIESSNLLPIKIKLIVGMCSYDGLTVSVHEGFKALMGKQADTRSEFVCQYLCEGHPVHSKLYIWRRNEEPVTAFIGSANYTQVAFSKVRGEIMSECSPNSAQAYFDQLEPRTIYCNHSEVEDYIILKRQHPILDAEDSAAGSLIGASTVKLSLLTKNGEVGDGSGINWGHRPKREPNQAYIPVPRAVARTNFFPPNGEHFTALTDDGKLLILRIEQSGDKAIATPMSNSLLGEYFRQRLELPNGAFITKEDLESYGRTDVTFYKFDEEQFYMDFSV